MTIDSKPTIDLASSMELREIIVSDYPELVKLWLSSPGIGLTKSDERDSFEFFLQRNPGMSVAAIDEAGRIIGSALCGHDGRRGFLYHVAVSTEERGKGVARRLVDACLETLRREGIEKASLFCLEGNTEGMAFWTAMGWELRTDIVVFSKLLTGAPEDG